MKGWDSNANKQNRGNQHPRTSELLLYIQILFFFFFFFFFFFYVFSLSLSEARSRNTNKFQHNGIWWRQDTNRSNFQTARFEPRNRSTTSPQVIGHASTADLTKKVNPCLRIEEHKKERNQNCRCMINFTS
jgi:hypothetical protein